MKNNNDALLKLKIKNLYTEYKKFMEINNLPSFEIKLYDGTKSENRGISAFVSYNNIFILNIEKNILNISPKTINSTLFHEFTHILVLNCLIVSD